MYKKIGWTVMCLVLGACSSTVKKAEDVSQSTPTPIVSAPLVKAPSVQATPVAAPDSEAVKQARMIQELAKKSVYFDYDEFSVKPQFQDVVQQQATFMLQTNKDKVTLEGNADERGSTEYNLALGQKRAEAVRKALLILGVADSRIEAISYGKEKLRATCHEEQCWQEDRRVDFFHNLK